MRREGKYKKTKQEKRKEKEIYLKKGGDKVGTRAPKRNHKNNVCVKKAKSNAGAGKVRQKKDRTFKH